MAKKEEFTLDTEEQISYVPVDNTSTKKVEKETIYKKVKQERKEQSEALVNPLRNERVSIQFIPKQGKISNPKHVLYGNMAENAYRVFVTPKLQSGYYVNVLTDEEKEFLEDAMGLEYNALSVYKKEGNFWDGDIDSISRVKLYKTNNYLDLSNPEDYIKYKILLANKNYIAPSLQVLQDTPKATYQFVIVREEEANKTAKSNMSNTMKCYKEFGKIEEDADKLRLIIETIDGRKTAPGTKLDFLQTRVNNLIQADPKLFLKVVTDSLLDTKVLIKKCIDAGIITYRGNGLYLREDNSPLCDHNQEPTLNNAALYLNSPKRQDLLFSLQNKVKQ